MRVFNAIALATLLALGWMTYALAGSIEYDARVSVPTPVFPELRCNDGAHTCERVVRVKHNALRCTLTGRCASLTDVH